MARDFAVQFYHSKAWKCTRAAYMAATVDVPGIGACPPYMCERCFTLGRLNAADIVHHITWLTPENINDPAATLDPRNLMRVCRDCHAAIHYPDFESRVSFGPDGEVLPL